MGNSVHSMGQITMRSRGQLIENPPVTNGNIGSLIVSDNPCQSQFSFSVIVETNVWVEFDVPLSSTITKIGGGAFVNGETLAANQGYLLTMNGYVSPIPSQNTLTDAFRIRTKVSNGGSLLDSAEVVRDHNGDLCSP